MKSEYEPLTTNPLSELEEGLKEGDAEAAPHCGLRCCRPGRCRRVVRVLGCVVGVIALLAVLPMLFGPPRHHHPWGPHGGGDHHGGDHPWGPRHGGPDDGPGGLDEAHGAAMSMAAFEVEAALGPAARDRRALVNVVRGPQADGAEALDWGSLRSFVVVLLGRDAPQRRAPGQPFLTIEPASLLPTAAINQAAAAYEAAVNRTLFPIRIQLADLAARSQRPADRPARPGDEVRPYVVYDVSKGLVTVDAQLLAGLEKVAQAQAVVAASAGAFLESLAGMVGKHLGPVDPFVVFEMASTASGVAVAAAFASAVPMWFCLACPAVLGLALPLAINMGLGELVNLACDHFRLSPEQCLDLGVGALAVGFVLAMASALPIFKVCKMYQCSHKEAPAAGKP